MVGFDDTFQPVSVSLPAPPLACLSWLPLVRLEALQGSAVGVKCSGDLDPPMTPKQQLCTDAHIHTRVKGYVQVHVDVGVVKR